MKVRFYCDVPVTNYAGPATPLSLMALTTLPQHAPSPLCKRIFFDVDFPPEVLIRHEPTAGAIASNVTVIDEPELGGQFADGHGNDISHLVDP